MTGKIKKGGGYERKIQDMTKTKYKRKIEKESIGKKRNFIQGNNRAKRNSAKYEKEK